MILLYGSFPNTTKGAPGNTQKLCHRHPWKAHPLHNTLKKSQKNTLFKGIATLGPEDVSFALAPDFGSMPPFPCTNSPIAPRVISRQVLFESVPGPDASSPHNQKASVVFSTPPNALRIQISAPPSFLSLAASVRSRLPYCARANIPPDREPKGRTSAAGYSLRPRSEMRCSQTSSSSSKIISRGE